MSKRDWVKVHLVCGVKTNIVTAVEITDRFSADIKYFKPLIDATAQSSALTRLFGAQMKSSNQELHDAALAVLDSYQKRAAELHNAFAPTLDARADTLKTIVSLSSASIVLSFTFSSSLRQLNAGSIWRYLIVISFALFTVALITAFFGLWWGTRAYQLQSRMIDERLKMNFALMTEQSAKEIATAMDKIASEALKPVYRADFHVSALHTISGVSFCVAIVLLAIVGAARLLL